jgi:segregation and condensation protein B
MLVAAIGAALFACDEPVGARELGEAFGGVPAEEIDEAVSRLQAALDGAETGLRVESVAGGFQLSTRPEVGPWVRRFFRQRNRARLSHAALETLAVVAYRQPVTAPEIQSIRGKDSTAALKTLLDKRLVRLLGRKKVVGNPLLYGTSRDFLVHFGLNRLEDLPSIEDFDGFVDGFAEDADRAIEPEERPIQPGDA